MTYYECADCGQLADFVYLEDSAVRRRCPVCEEPTAWEIAFADDGAGVSF
ncbi:hypothetical protein [Haladaptatus halobius]|nr:hypothetical protein [Haladaptatus halobius]